MIHDENVIAGLSSWQLIQQLINTGRLAPLSFIDSWVFNDYLPSHQPVQLASYYSTCWMTPQQVMNFEGRYKEKAPPEIAQFRKLTIADTSKLVTTEFDDTNTSLAGWSLIVNYMIEHKINVLADSGTVKDFLAESTRGALVSIASNKPQLLNEASTVLDINSFYWFCLSEIDVGTGLPKSITPKMTVQDVLNLVNDGAIVYVKCPYEFVQQTNLNKPATHKCLTSYDILSGNYRLLDSADLSGFYWLPEKVMHKPFKPLVERLYKLRKDNPTLKRVLNAGIGRLIKKWNPVYHRPISVNTSHSNPSYLGLDNKQSAEKWANTVDYTNCFHQLHSQILSFAGYYLQQVVFKHCLQHNVQVFYTSTDSIAIKTSDLERMKPFIGDGLGQMKIEAQSNDEGALYIQKGIYYVSEAKYCARSCSHELIEEYCAKNNITIRQLFERLLTRPVTVVSSTGSSYTLRTAVIRADSLESHELLSTSTAAH